MVQEMDLDDRASTLKSFKLRDALGGSTLEDLDAKHERLEDMVRRPKRLALCSDCEAEPWLQEET